MRRTCCKPGRSWRRPKRTWRESQDRAVTETAQANLQIAHAQLNKTDLDVKRLKPLAEQQAVPQQDYDNALAAQQGAQADVKGKESTLNTAKVNQVTAIQQAQAAIETANATIREAELNLEYCTITSPISGVETRLVSPGNLVGQGEATLLTTVSDVNPMRVYVDVSERKNYLMYSRLKTEGKLRQRGGDLELILADGTLFPEKGKVIIADRAVDLKTGTIRLVTEFGNPKALLRPGQFGRVRLAATTAKTRSSRRRKPSPRCKAPTWFMWSATTTKWYCAA